MKYSHGFMAAILLSMMVPSNSSSHEVQRPSLTNVIKWQAYTSGGLVAGGSYRLQQAVGQTAVGYSNPADQRCNSGFEQAFQKSACCAGVSGNVDCDVLQGVDISDLSALIDYLYISFAPLCCPGEANTDGDPLDGIDISDLSALIDYLYISFTPPATCQ